MIKCFYTIFVFVLIAQVLLLTTIPQINAQHGAQLKSLNKNNYRTYLKSHPPTLVYFTANGCVQCDNTLPEFQNANQRYIDQQYQNNPKLTQRSVNRFILVNCSDPDQEEICLEYIVEGFPTVLFVQFPSYYEEYTGARLSAKMLRYFNYITQPLIPQLNTINEYLIYKTTDVDQDDFIKCILHIPSSVQHILDIPQIDATHEQLRIKNQHNRYVDHITTIAQRHRTVGSFAMINQTLIHQAIEFKDKSEMILLSTKLNITKNEFDHYYKTYPTTGDNVYYLEIYRSFDENRLEFIVNDPTDIERYYLNSNIPLFGTITPQNYNYYLQRNVPIVWIFYDYNNLKSPKIQQFHITFENLSRSIKQDKLLFVKVDSKLYHNHAITFGIKQNTLNYPGIVIEDRFHRKNYIYPYIDQNKAEPNKNNNNNNDNNTDNNNNSSNNDNNNNDQYQLNSLQEWFNNYLSSSLKHTIRSENDEKYNIGENLYIKNLIGKYYEDYLYNTTLDKDVFVIFYASWCAQTPKLRYKFVDLLNNTNVVVNNTITTQLMISNETTIVNNTLKYDQNLIIAQIDISFNDIPYHLSQSFDITRTPTLYFYEAGRPEPSSLSPLSNNINNNEPIHKNKTYIPIKYTHLIDTESLYQFIALNRKSQPNLHFPEDFIIFGNDMIHIQNNGTETNHNKDNYGHQKESDIVKKTDVIRDEL